MVEGEGLRVPLLLTRLSSSPEAGLQRAPTQVLNLLRGDPCEEVSKEATPPSAGFEQSVPGPGGFAADGVLGQERWTKLCVLTQLQRWASACGTTP